MYKRDVFVPEGVALKKVEQKVRERWGEREREAESTNSSVLHSKK